MRNLQSTISLLSRYRRQWAGLHQAPNFEQDAADASHLTEHTGFGSNPGALRMFTHAPRTMQAAPALVVVLHGCTQSAAGYDRGAGWSTLAERHGFMLLLPEQPRANNPKTCFNWFSPADAARDSGEALSIRQMIEQCVTAHNVDRSRIFITGLSAGGAMTAAMLATYPEVFAAGATIAGLPYGAAVNVQQAFESMFQGPKRTAREWGDVVRRASRHSGPWPRISVWHGDADATVVPVNAEGLVRQWTDLHGIQSAPVLDVVDGHPRAVWRRDGVDVVESFTIKGMAHGTPLATGENGVGRAGAFLLDVGISSSRHIADFFGLTDLVSDRAARSAKPKKAFPRPPQAETTTTVPDEQVEILDAHAGPESPGRLGPRNDVLAVITKALTSAGLLPRGDKRF